MKIQEKLIERVTRTRKFEAYYVDSWKQPQDGDPPTCHDDYSGELERFRRGKATNNLHSRALYPQFWAELGDAF
jgi:hypothetical protein